VGVTYSSTSQPYGRVDFLDARTGEITRTIGVDMRSPVMLHDSAISRKHVIILDLPLTVRPARMLLDRFPVEYEPDFGARLGLTSRETGETTWVAVAREQVQGPAERPRARCAAASDDSAQAECASPRSLRHVAHSGPRPPRARAARPSRYIH